MCEMKSGPHLLIDLLATTCLKSLHHHLLWKLEAVNEVNVRDLLDLIVCLSNFFCPDLAIFSLIPFESVLRRVVCGLQLCVDLLVKQELPFSF